MIDPWDVKSVRQSGQYVSCLKINGVPLLPPVLSRECRKEMQYYKLLAKEVEKRISLLRHYSIVSDTDSEDRTDAPDIPECEHIYELSQEEVQTGFNITIDNITAITKENHIESTYQSTPVHLSPEKTAIPSTMETETNKKIVIDFNLKINETGLNILESQATTPPSLLEPIELPERDCDYKNEANNHKKKELLLDMESIKKVNLITKDIVHDIVNFRCSINKKTVADPFSDIIFDQDGPSSISSKSFTGSLNDLHTESVKHSPTLIRQSSYTILHPSPQLIAHLQVQSQNTGVDMCCISMSESLSNLSPGKKRRSWDLETAKEKWSTMALELKQKNIEKSENSSAKIQSSNVTPSARKIIQSSPYRARSVAERRRSNINTRWTPKSEPQHKSKKAPSPVRRDLSNSTVQQLSSPKNKQKKEMDTKTQSAVEDPASRVRELYEKIQKQQLHQMAGLVEKQKKEQLLLQHVFEEQNHLLYNQLKVICPKSPVELKEAWGDKSDEERGPVSLSQLINLKSQDQRVCDSPISTLTDTNHYINHCDNVLKKSRDISNTLKMQAKSRGQDINGNGSPRSLTGSKIRTHSPMSQRHTPASRKLNYDTSSDRENDHLLTDRTNDTMADLNVTFPTDRSEDSYSIDCTLRPQLAGLHGRHSKTDSAIKSMEKTIQESINTMPQRLARPHRAPPTARERAAASKIVAVAKGYLVRRLMRSARVQATVQTIRDALLCALQLHQDREGIRGADVDLHRRLIQQITAACYSLHDTFVASSAAERCAAIAADRQRRRDLAARPHARPARPPARGTTDF